MLDNSGLAVIVRNFSEVIRSKFLNFDFWKNSEVIKKNFKNRIKKQKN